MRDVLLALCGLTPQVVTETLWALAHQDPPVHPHELRILTTQGGRDLCRQTMLGERGVLAAFSREFRRGKPKLRFDASRIQVLRGAAGRPLEDLRSERDNGAAADQIAGLVRRLTEDPAIRVHGSVAGGRKTMGIFLAGAFHLYGRAEDRLYHVLVSPEFEAHPSFFYKPRKSQRLLTREGVLLQTDDARIELAEIPYVRVRDMLPAGAFVRNPGYTALVQQAQQELRATTAHQRVRLVPATRRLIIGETAVDLKPTAFGLYHALARIKMHRCVEPNRPTCQGCTACYLPISGETWLEIRANLAGLVQDRVTLPQEVEHFRSARSKVNRVLSEALGSNRMAERYGIQSVGDRNHKAYGLAADKTVLLEEA